jgi:hypothetical protein
VEVVSNPCRELAQLGSTVSVILGQCGIDSPINEYGGQSGLCGNLNTHGVEYREGPVVRLLI